MFVNPTSDTFDERSARGTLQNQQSSHSGAHHITPCHGAWAAGCVENLPVQLYLQAPCISAIRGKSGGLGTYSCLKYSYAHVKVNTPLVDASALTALRKCEPAHRAIVSYAAGFALQVGGMVFSEAELFVFF